MLSDESQRFITSQYKRRRLAAKILTWFFTPFALIFLYAFAMVLLEEEGLSSLLTAGGLPTVAIFPIIIFSAFYPILNLIKIRSDIKKLPEFKVSVVEGIPKLKERYYRHSFKSPSGAIFGAHQRIGFTGTIDGVKYDFRAVQPSAIASAPMRFTAITRKSWLLLCNWKNFVVEVQELSQGELKRYEDDRIKDWPTGEYANAVPLNRIGRLSAAQVKMLRWDRFKVMLLWLFLLCCGALLMLVGGWPLTTNGLVGLKFYGVILLVVLGAACLCASVYLLSREIISEDVTGLAVLSFIGKVKKTRAATYAEYQQSDRELVTAPTVTCGNKMFLILPEDLFDKIPTTREMRYYYVHKKKEHYGTVINFENA